MSEEKTYRTLSRRGFLKTTAAAAGVAAAGGTLASLGAAKQAQAAGEEQIFTTICRANCFQACLLNAHVRDGKVVKMSRGEYPEEIYSGCCLRGLTLPERTYANNRLKYPLKRKEGTERGAGEWEQISWDQATTEIAEKIVEIQTKYGPKAMCFSTGSGNYGPVQGRALHRLIFTAGGTIPNGMYDYALGWGTTRVMGGGTFGYSNEPKDMLNADEIIIWGTNPVWAQPQTWRIILAAKDNGARLTCIDPMRSATSFFCDEWIRINNGTDLYMTLAMLNEVVKNDAIDVAYAKSTTTAPFLIRKDTGLFLRQSDIEGGELADKRDATTVNTVGNTKKDPAYVIDAVTGEKALFTECADPVLEGEFTVDGFECITVYSALKKHIAKYTVADASKICGVPEETINKLIGLYTSGRVVQAYTQYGIDHYRGSHLWGQALAMLHGLTNNLSRPGSGIGGPGSPDGTLFPMGAGNSMYTGTKPLGYYNYNSGICAAAWKDVLKTGKYMGQDYPCKGYFGNAENPMSNNSDQNLWLNVVVKELELIAMIDFEMTDTCRYADYVLPGALWLECVDVRGNFSNPYVAYGPKCIEPLYECKTDNEIASIIAEKMGLGEAYGHYTDEQWIDIFLSTDACKAKGLTQENLKKQNAIRVVGTPEKPWIIGGYGAEFPTPSGRIELYCEIPTARYVYGQDWQSEAAQQQFPIWEAPYENWHGAEIRKKYPLGFINLHQRGRTHTQWFELESIREIDPEPLLHLSREDAEARGLATGDVAEAFNDRGHAVAKVIIDDMLPQGLCYIPKGWQRHQYIAGCYQELTNNVNDFVSGGYNFYDVAVEVKKWEA